MFCESFFFYFLPVNKSSISCSFRISLLTTNSLSFPSSQNGLIFPLYSWRIFPLNTGFWLKSYFLSAHGRCVATFFWTPWFLKRKLLSFELIFFPVGEVLLFSCCFQDFYFVLDSRHSIMMCLGMDFIRFILFENKYLESVHLCLLPNLGCLQPLFLQVLPFSFFWDSSDPNVGSHSSTDPWDC